jgi:type I restriction enzyme, S subunit
VSTRADISVCDSGDAPAGWHWATLSGLGPLTDGDWILNEHYAESGIRLLQVGDIGRGHFRDRSSRYISEQTSRELRCTLLEPGDILISRMPDPLGRACRLPDLGYPCITAVDVSIWRPDDALVDREYLTYYLSTSEWLSVAAGMASGATRPRISRKALESLKVPVPPLAEQRRMAAELRQQLEAAARIRAAADATAHGLDMSIAAILRSSMSGTLQQDVRLGDCLIETKKGVGAHWSECPVLGVTRHGAALAKEPPGKQPERYKPVTVGTVFYNPMRILIGSIGLVDQGDVEGITSPEYVVVTCVEGVLHPRWFYWWLRSADGARFIRSRARGAVRERMLFSRLEGGRVNLPTWAAQLEAAEKMLKMSRIHRHVELQASALDSLPSALLREAFS